MPSETTIRPPVTAGNLTSRIKLKHDHSINRADQKQATALHEWTFDLWAYSHATGLDLGAEYPWVPQENGHVLAVRRDVTWTPEANGTTTSSDETWYTVFVKEDWMVRQHTADTVRHCEYHVHVNGDGCVSGVDDEAFSYDGTPRDRADPMRIDLQEGHYVGDPMQFTRRLHFGFAPWAEPPEEQIEYLIDADTPDDGVDPEEYECSESAEAPTAGD